MSICGYDYDDITTDFEEWLDDEKISGRQDALDPWKQSEQKTIVDATKSFSRATT